MSVSINIGVTYNGRNIRKSFADLNTLRKQADNTGDRLRAMGAQINLVGGAMQSIGTSLTRNLTLPIVGLGAAAIRSSVEFDTAFTNVIKTVDATEGQLADLRSGIREMATELPATASEIAEVASAAGQLGIQTDNILGFTRVMIDLGETTNLTADEAATAFARFANILQTPQDEFDRLGSTVAALGNNLATTEREIVELGMRLAAAGGQIGLTEAQILAFAGALSSVGVEAEAGGSAFSRVFRDINSAVISGGEELQNFAAIAGMSAEQFAAVFRDDAAEAIRLFVAGLGRIRDRGGDVAASLETVGLNSLRVRDALGRAAGAGDLLTNALRLGTQAFDENTALAEEAELRYSSSGAQFEIFRNRLNDVAIELGDELAPALLEALDALEPVIESVKNAASAFADLSDDQQQAIIKTTALVAVLGPLAAILGAIAKPIGVLVAALPKIAAALGAIGATIAIIGGAPIAALVAGLASIVGLGVVLANRNREVAETTGVVNEEQRFAALAAEERRRREARLAGQLGKTADANADVADATEDATDAIEASGPVVVRLTREMRGFFQQLNQTQAGAGDAGAMIAQFSREVLAAGNITEATARGAEALARAIRQDLDRSLANANRKLDDAVSKFEAYRDAIAGGIRSGNTISDAVRNQTAAQDALTRAQEEYERAKSGDDAEALEDAADALKQAEKNERDFLEFLQVGVTTAEGFAAQIDAIREAGASLDVVQQIAELGAETGGRIASELLAGGAAAIEQANRMVTAVENASRRAGESAAQQFFGAGVAAARAMVRGIEATIPELQSVLDRIAEAIERAIGTRLDVDISGGPRPFIQTPGGAGAGDGRNALGNIPFTPDPTRALPQLPGELRWGQGGLPFIPGLANGGLVTEPTLAMIGEAGPEVAIPLDRLGSMGNTINITVTSADPQAVVDAIRRYTRANGPLGQVVSV